MTTYELMLLVAPSVDMTAEKTQKELIEKLVGKAATVIDITSLGKKSLAYPIRKHTEATYLVAHLSGTVKSGELDTKAKLMDEIIRCLLTVKE